jgi:acetyl esterase/lipase
MKKDLVYDEKNQLALDVYEPEQIEAAILLIHGGGWFRGDKQKEKQLAERLADDHFLVVSPNYRLAPDFLYPAALVDVFAAYEWLRAADYPLPAGKIAALGSSAGGNLAIELALQKGIPAASWSGIIDLADWVAHHEAVAAAMNQKPDFDQQDPAKIDQSGLNDAFYKWFVLNYVGQNQKLLQEADPLQRVSPAAGPIFMANSLKELVPLSGVFKLQAALTKNKVPSETRILAGTVHGEGYTELVYQNTVNFLRDSFL